jgi:glycosyltransferase involved in cell wall biosynthesis
LAKTRIAFINTHPVQYFGPLYAYLNATEDLSVTAIYLSDFSIRGGSDRAFGQAVKWDVDILAGYESRFIEGASRRNEAAGFFSVLAPTIWREVRDGAFDAVVVHGHTPAAVLLAAAAAKTSRVPLFTRGETHLGLVRSPIKRALRAPVMRAYYGQLTGALAIGSANRVFYRAMGVPENRIFSMPYTVDNERFITTARLCPSKRMAARKALGVEDNDPIVLYAAKFVPRKRAGDLIRAAALLRRSGHAFHLVMVGSGEMEAELRALALALDLDNVRFAGFVNQSALPGVYAASDIFVLPSQNEPWGLTVNEAMCAGLPVIVSAEVGCATDLVRDGVNGVTFPAGNVEALAGALRPLIEDAALRRRMGAASREIISRWSYAECLDGLRAALASVNL